MGLSPRQINAYLKQKLREKRLLPERRKDPTAIQEKEFRRIPTNRLATRLGLAEYVQGEIAEVSSLAPECVYIPFLQHIGKRAVPVKNCGEQIERGELLAVGAEESPSANIRGSISGIIRFLDEEGAVIEAIKE